MKPNKFIAPSTSNHLLQMKAMVRSGDFALLAPKGTSESQWEVSERAFWCVFERISRDSRMAPREARYLAILDATIALSGLTDTSPSNGLASDDGQMGKDSICGSTRATSHA